MSDFVAGDRWLEVESSRVIVILSGDKPWWYYEDDHKETPWYCCIEDFYIWKRFIKLV